MLINNLIQIENFKYKKNTLTYKHLNKLIMSHQQTNILSTHYSSINVTLERRDWASARAPSGPMSLKERLVRDGGRV